MLDKSSSSEASTTSLEQFVYAEVAPEPNGMPLSVLSALARRGLDPWQEASRLAELPGPAAVDRLAHTLVGLPLMRSSLNDATAIAARLVTLLPSAPAMASMPFNAPKLATALPAMPRWMMLGMAAVLVGGVMMPLLEKRDVPTVAPASWLTNGPEEHAAPISTAAHEAAAAHPAAHAPEAEHPPTSAPSRPS